MKILALIGLVAIGFVFIFGLWELLYLSMSNFYSRLFVLLLIILILGTGIYVITSPRVSSLLDG